VVLKKLIIAQEARIAQEAQIAQEARITQEVSDTRLPLVERSKCKGFSSSIVSPLYYLYKTDI
jgi:hypothetical protein